ncbi:hypothetical protein RQP46_002265 [Phenoliferia psychrophenolica]
MSSTALPTSTRVWVVANPPEGEVTPDTFALKTEALPSELPPASILVEVLYISNDPAQRGWIQKDADAARLYVPPLRSGDPMRAGVVARVLATSSDLWKVGALVTGWATWAEFVVLPEKGVEPVPEVLPSPTLALSMLGVTALTAWFGLHEVGFIKPEHTVVISGAAGSTGSIAVQIAKNMTGCKRVVGIAGGKEKCDYVKSLGADECVDYKSATFEADLAKATPGYADVYFDNVGGSVLNAMLPRVAHSDTSKAVLPNWFEVISNRITIRGFIVFDWPDKVAGAISTLAAALQAGQLKTTGKHETIREVSFEEVPEVWKLLFEGANTGKLITKLAVTHSIASMSSDKGGGSPAVDMDKDRKWTESHIEEMDANAVALAGAETREAGKNPWHVLLANKRALLIILAVQSNAIFVGFEFTLPGTLLGVPAFVKQFGSIAPGATEFAVEAKHLVIWGAIFSVFQIMGQFAAGWCADRWGRRLSIFSMLFYIYLGVALEIIAKDWKGWLGSKIVVGFGTGYMLAAVPTYVTEIAPREIRGIMLSFFNLAMNIGGLAATIVPWACNSKWGSDVDDVRAFKVPLYIALGIPTLTLILELFVLVESPWWLLFKGRRDEARASLLRLNGGVPGYSVEKDLAQLDYTLQKEQEQTAATREVSFRDCLRGVDARRTFCACFPSLTQNLTGQNLVGTYSTYFFLLAGQKDPLISSVIVTLVGMSTNFATFFTIESKRVGRWALLIGGLATMTLSMLSIAIIDVASKGVYSSAAGILLVLFLAFFTVGSTAGPGATGWVYTGESGSARLRAKTTTLGTCGNATVGLVFNSALPYMLNVWGAKSGFLFAGLGATSCVIVYLFIPDFTGRTFAELDELFARKIPARKFRSTTTTGDYGRDLDQDQ